MAIYIVLGAVAGAMGAGLIVWFLGRSRAPNSPLAFDPQSLLLIQNQLNELSKVMDSKLTESSRFMQDSLRVQASESNKIIRDIVQELTKVGEGQKQVMSFADQLRSLQDILKNPKQRGILGEYYLETLLKNVLAPGQYQMQYPFPDGTIVDAIVRVKEKIIPVDSKFSLENYNRLVNEADVVERKKLEKSLENDLKNRIIETSKYIQPAQGTMDFAFMFIPHEAIYYDLLVGRVGDGEENLIQRAASKYKVIIVSPTSFLAYLQTVLQGLKALQIEETAKDIIRRVEDLGKHLKTYEDYHNKLGNALGTVVNHYTHSSKELKKVDKDILRISGVAPGLEPELIEGPSRED